jgi:histidinol-phosphatase
VNRLTSQLEFAKELAQLGGKVAMGHFRHNPRARRKADGSWVTQGDWETEAQIRLRVARTFPQHNVHGEEEGLTRAGGGPPLDGAPTWVIDPIDGTSNYVAGIPVWATLVGLLVDDRSVVGVAHAPALGETYDAARGLGARMNGQSIRVSDLASLKEATVLSPGYESFLEHDVAPFFVELATKVHRSRGFGDFWGHMLVARGAAHIMAEPVLRLWDYAALVPIVEEAGGRITTLEGGPLTDGSSCLTSNGILHDEVVALRLAGLRVTGVRATSRDRPG